jgi:hypothetical protein
MSTPANAITNAVQLPLFAAPGVLVPKLMHAGSDWTGQPYIYIDDSSVALRSKIGQGIIIDNVFGTGISGPLSVYDSLENVHFGAGYWTLNPLQLEMIGSSAATPMPMLASSTPKLLSAASTVSSSVSMLQAADPNVPSS